MLSYIVFVACILLCRFETHGLFYSHFGLLIVVILVLLTLGSYIKETFLFGIVSGVIRQKNSQKSP